MPDYPVVVPPQLGEKLGWNLLRRKEEFAKREATQSKETFRLTFANEPIVRDQWLVPIDLPRYRLENGRTSSAQIEWVARHPEAGADFFRRDPESIEAQYVQHTILREMVDAAELRTLFKDGTIKQDEPLILDHNGYVVNGNRRLCLWRDLLSENSAKHGHFDHVRVITLPEVSAQAITKLEAALQVRRNVRADYVWHALAHMYKWHRDNEKLSDKEIAALYEEDDASVHEYLEMLRAAEAFLESRNKRDQWSTVTRDEFAFRKIVQGRAKLKKIDDLALFQVAAHNAIDWEETPGRSYEVVPNIVKYLPAIKEELIKQFPVPPASGGNPLLGSAKPDVGMPLAKEINKPENRNLSAKIINATIEERKRLEVAKKSTDAFLRFLKSANGSLAAAELELGTPPKPDTGGALEQLALINAAVERLRKRL